MQYYKSKTIDSHTVTPAEVDQKKHRSVAAQTNPVTFLSQFQVDQEWNQISNTLQNWAKLPNLVAIIIPKIHSSSTVVLYS